MVYQLEFSPFYERDIKRLKRKRRDLRRLFHILSILRQGKQLANFPCDFAENFRWALYAEQ